MYLCKHSIHESYRLRLAEQSFSNLSIASSIARYLCTITQSNPLLYSP